jgi:hypothetical protein
MDPVEAILLLLVAVAALASLARRLRIAEPILLVLGGLALGFIPAPSSVEFPPHVVFLLFVPPLVYLGGVLTPWRDTTGRLRHGHSTRDRCAGCRRDSALDKAHRVMQTTGVLLHVVGRDHVLAVRSNSLNAAIQFTYVATTGNGATALFG